MTYCAKSASLSHPPSNSSVRTKASMSDGKLLVLRTGICDPRAEDTLLAPTLPCAVVFAEDVASLYEKGCVSMHCRKWSSCLDIFAPYPVPDPRHRDVPFAEPPVFT